MNEKRLDTLLEKAQVTWDSYVFDVDPLPVPDEFGQVKLPYQTLRKICHDRMRAGWSTGVFDTMAAFSTK